MRLLSVTLKNFRCFKEAYRIDIDNLTTFIGKNDIGKSSVLEALEIFFNNELVKIDIGDCNVLATEQSVEITCEFEGYPESLVLDSQAPTSLRDEYLLAANGNLIIRKSYRCTTAKPKEEVFILANHPTASQYDDLLLLTNSALKKRLTDLEIDSTGVQLNSNPSIRRRLWDSCQDLALREQLIAVAKEDSKKIWENISNYLPLFALFQSDRTSKDSDSEVQDPMKLAITAALSEPEIQRKLIDVVEAVKLKAVDLANRTHDTLKKMDANLASQIVPEFKTDPKWASLFSIVLNGDQGIPINKRGSGVRRLILVSFFRAEAERRRIQDIARSIIYAIEEPETSQHPNNQLILLESLQDLASETGCQVLLTTHSPGFASYLPQSSFRFVTRDDHALPRVTSGLNVDWESLVQTLGVVPDNRVQVLICVEGPTDVHALRALSRALHDEDETIIDLTTHHAIAFVVLGGGALVHWVNENYLQGFGRPEVHLYDSDVTKYATSIATVNSRGDGSWGAQTLKREIENYLHSDAIREGLDLTIIFGDDDDVPAMVSSAKGWSTNTAKKKLASQAFPRMTAMRLRETDTSNEVENWLRRIGSMIR